MALGGGLGGMLKNPIIVLVLIIVLIQTIITAGLINAYSASVGSANAVLASMTTVAAIIWLFGGGKTK